MYAMMATSISIPCCPNLNSSSVLAHNPLLTKTQISPPLRTPILSRKPFDNRILKELCKQGSLKEAFASMTDLFTDRNSLLFCPHEAYASLLELCAIKKALLQGQQIHACIIKSSEVSPVFLGTKLVFMYGKCGSLFYAEKVFDKMHDRTIFTWNAMIGAYVSNLEPVGALETYRELRVSGVALDACSFLCVFKACSVLKDLQLGAEIHSLVIKSGFDSVEFVVNSLVAMYAKCDDLNGARQLFDQMTEKEDVVLWNSIISAYSANGHSIEALALFREMQVAGLASNTYTSLAALQACVDSSFRKPGMEIHSTVLKSSQNLDVHVANALISMYVRCNQMSHAARVFTQLDEKDSVSWNSLISGYVQNGMHCEALFCFREFKCVNQIPDQVSVMSIVAASGQLGYLFYGKEIHAYAIKNDFDSDVQVGNTLIDMYAKCRYPNYMGGAFDRLHYKDIISWTTIIAGYAQNNRPMKALQLFHEVQMGGMDVDAMMLGSILQVCGAFKIMSQVKEIHGYLLRRGLSDLVLQNKMLHLYGDCGSIDYATRIFELIKYKDTVSWTSMISAYVHNGLANEALELFYLMKDTNVEPDSVALSSILLAAASLSALNKGKEMHSFIIRKGFVLEESIASSLVDMYSSSGTLENAYKVFSCIQKKSLVVWTSMINAYGLHGLGKAAIDLFNRMDTENLIPDHITFLTLLHACSHSGLINEGKLVLETMEHEYQLEPWPEHYACMVDLLCRSNRLHEALQFIESLRIEATAEVWRAFLGACRVPSNPELGEIASRKLLELQPQNPGNYVLVSNVLAASGRWQDVDEVRARMKVGGLRKNPGCSWIEIGNKIHAFMARDKSHPHSADIYQKLAEITKELEREAGYVAQTKGVLFNVDKKMKVEMLHAHSERLAIAYGLLETSKGTTIRISKNLRVCHDCHTFCKLVSKFTERRLVVRDANRFHHFENGACSCGDFW